MNHQLKAFINRRCILLMLLVVETKFLLGISATSVVSVFPSLLIERPNRTIASNYTVAMQSNIGSFAYEKLAILYASRHLVQIFSGPLMGFLIEKYGPLIMMWPGIILQCVTFVVYSFCDEYKFLIIGRISEALSFSTITCSIGTMIILEFSEDKKRGIVYGFGAISICVGISVGPVYGGWMYQNHGKVLTFLCQIVGSIVIVLTLVAFLLIRRMDTLRNQKEHPDDHKDCVTVIAVTEIIGSSSHLDCHRKEALKNRGSGQFRLFFTDPFFMTLLVSFFVTGIVGSIWYSTLPTYMFLVFGSSETEQGMIWVFNLLGYITGFVCGNVCNSKFSEYRHIILTISTTIHGICVLILPLIRMWRFLSIPLCFLVMHVLINEIIIIPLMASIVHHRHQSKFGIMSGLLLTISSITGFAGSFSGPILLKLIGFERTNLILFVSNVLYAPLFLCLEKVVK